MKVPDAFICRDGLPAPVVDADKAPLYRCYRDRKDKDRLWLVSATHINPADHIYVGYPFNTSSPGFAGRWLVFNLVDHNSAVSLQGPFHSNADALYECTGIDVRDKHYVQLVVGLSRENGPSYRTTLSDIVYFEEPGVRSYNDYKATLRSLYEQHKVPLYYWHGGSGGSETATYSSRDYERSLAAERAIQTSVQ